MTAYHKICPLPVNDNTAAAGSTLLTHRRRRHKPTNITHFYLPLLRTPRARASPRIIRRGTEFGALPPPSPQPSTTSTTTTPRRRQQPRSRSRSKPPRALVGRSPASTPAAAFGPQTRVRTSLSRVEVRSAPRRRQTFAAAALAAASHLGLHLSNWSRFAR